MYDSTKYFLTSLVNSTIFLEGFEFSLEKLDDMSAMDETGVKVVSP